MASCTSGQDKPTSALWLATQAGNIELSCLPGLPAISCKLNFPESHYNKVFIDQVWDQVGWILASFCFCEFMDLDSVSVSKRAQKNLANIQPSWPRSWSITRVIFLSTSPWSVSQLKGSGSCSWVAQGWLKISFESTDCWTNNRNNASSPVKIKLLHYDYKKVLHL